MPFLVVEELAKDGDEGVGVNYAVVAVVALDVEAGKVFQVVEGEAVDNVAVIVINVVVEAVLINIPF